LLKTGRKRVPFSRRGSKLLHVTSIAIYYLIERGVLPASQLSNRWTIVRRADIDAMLVARPYERKPKTTEPVSDENGEAVTEFYTTKEIIENVWGEQFVGVRPRKGAQHPESLSSRQKRFGARHIATEYSRLSRNRRRRMTGFRIRRSERNTISRMTSFITM